MANREQKVHPAMRALLHATQAYPASAYADKGPAKRDADAALLRAMQTFIASNIWASMVHPREFSLPLYNSVTVLSATRSSPTSGTLAVRFPVLPEYANAFASLAGGAHATAHDYGTGWALLTVARPGFWDGMGVSLSLNVTFLRPARVGEVLVLESEVVQAGARIAVLKGVLKRERDGAIVSVSEQHKAQGGGQAAKL